MDQSRCRGAGQCALIAPEVFDQGDEDGIVTLLEPSPAADLHPAVREAGAVCPASAIAIDDGIDDHIGDDH